MIAHLFTIGIIAAVYFKSALVLGAVIVVIATVFFIRKYECHRFNSSLKDWKKEADDRGKKELDRCKRSQFLE